MTAAGTSLFIDRKLLRRMRTEARLSVTSVFCAFGFERSVTAHISLYTNALEQGNIPRSPSWAKAAVKKLINPC